MNPSHDISAVCYNFVRNLAFNQDAVLEALLECLRTLRDPRKGVYYSTELGETGIGVVFVSLSFNTP